MKNPISKKKKPEQKVATQEQVNEYATLRAVTYGKAYRTFSRDGYDMSNVQAPSGNRKTPFELPEGSVAQGRPPISSKPAPSNPPKAPSGVSRPSRTLRDSLAEETTGERPKPHWTDYLKFEPGTAIPDPAPISASIPADKATMEMLKEARDKAAMMSGAPFPTWAATRRIFQQKGWDVSDLQFSALEPLITDLTPHLWDAVPIPRNSTRSNEFKPTPRYSSGGLITEEMLKKAAENGQRGVIHRDGIPYATIDFAEAVKVHPGETVTAFGGSFHSDIIGKIIDANKDPETAETSEPSDPEGFLDWVKDTLPGLSPSQVDMIRKLLDKEAEDWATPETANQTRNKIASLIEDQHTALSQRVYSEHQYRVLRDLQEQARDFRLAIENLVPHGHHKQLAIEHLEDVLLRAEAGVLQPESHEDDMPIDPDTPAGRGYQNG